MSARVRHPHRRDASGFSLVELLVALALSVLITSAVFALLDPANGAFQTQPEAADVMQRLRAASDVLSRELAAAGSAPVVVSDTSSVTQAAVFPMRVGRRGADAAGTQDRIARTMIQLVEKMQLAPVTFSVVNKPGAAQRAKAVCRKAYDEEQQETFERRLVELRRVPGQAVRVGWKDHAPGQCRRGAVEFAIDEIGNPPQKQTEGRDRRCDIEQGRRRAVMASATQIKAEGATGETTMKGHAALPDAQDLVGMAHEIIEIVKQHIAEPSAQNHAECRIKQHVINQRFGGRLPLSPERGAWADAAVEAGEGCLGLGFGGERRDQPGHRGGGDRDHHHLGELPRVRCIPSQSHLEYDGDHEGGRHRRDLAPGAR